VRRPISYRLITVIGALVALTASACSDQPAPDETPSPSPSTTATAGSTTPTPSATAPASPSATPATSTAVSPSPAPPTPTPGAPAAVVRSVDSSSVILTFDAGSDAGYTAQILDTLDAEGIRASFGITGEWAEENPGLVQRIAAEGHAFINHSYDHGSFTGFSDGRQPLAQAERWAQLDETDAVIQRETGKTSRPYFRPPYGDYDASVNADIGARGYRYNVMWTVDSFGWRGISAAEITARCLDLAEPGAIYIFHVGSSSQDGPALPDVIAGLRAAGYSFAHLPDVLP